MHKDAISLLKRLIATPSVSRDEAAAADIVESYFLDAGITSLRYANNVVAVNDSYDTSRPTLLLNAHLDTVKPSPNYTFNPYEPVEKDGCIMGLGSNDDGGSLVSLITVFLKLRKAQLPFNLIIAASAEEEVGGENGMRRLLPSLKTDGYSIDMAIVGEPTGMQPAIAERGLIVLDCLTKGKTGHAAREEGINAISRAIEDIRTLTDYKFPIVSDILGPVKISVTQIQAGRQHNVIPDECRWVVDVRTTDAYSNEETARMLQQAVSRHTIAQPRSTRVHASIIDDSHPLVKAAVKLGGTPFVSPTTSDMSLMYNFPSLKIGPGESSRSHSADEFIRMSEIEEAIDKYTELILNLAEILGNHTVEKSI